ncbi:hypothetical protein ACFL0G_06275, partial [Candidatus Zixiibacteriota bacterium]
MRTIVCAVLISVVMLTTAVLADVPGLMNYQGTLTDDNGMALDTTVAMTFSIYTDSTGGSQVWTETQPAVGVNSGIFNVLLGRVNAISDTVFKDPSRWLGVQVGDDPELAARQRIASVGYSFRAAEADTAKYATSGAADNDWLRGTPDSVLFTADYLGIARGGADNMLYGDAVHTHINLGVDCNTGAYGQNYAYCTVGGGLLNTASEHFATVSGGDNNFAGGDRATVSGGRENEARGDHTTVGGGGQNVASNDAATVGGGAYNIASGYGATLSGGGENRARGSYSVVSGGGGLFPADSNSAIGDHSAIGGGRGNIASGPSATVGGGYDNKASGGAATVSGGDNNFASGDRATV